MENLDLFSDYFTEEVNNVNFDFDNSHKNGNDNCSQEDQSVNNQASTDSVGDSPNEDTVENHVKESSEDKVSTPDCKVQIDQIKELCLRTDLSALAKVSQILNIIDGKPPETEVKSTSDTRKRPGSDSASDASNKHFKPSEEEPAECLNDEVGEMDSCVVCGLKLKVFKGDRSKEFNHYLSHGFRVLKEFDVLKPDDSLFLMCNICSSVYPRKCPANFRRHLVEEHLDKVVEIFRCD